MKILSIVFEYNWVFFSDGSPESILNCIEKIVQNYATLSSAARLSFEEDLNFEKNFNKIIEVLN